MTDNNPMTVGDLLWWLRQNGPDRVVHLGPLVASREVYAQPAVILRVGATALEAIREIEASLAREHAGYKGGVYRYTLGSECYFNFTRGCEGGKLTEGVIEAVISVVNNLKREQ